VQVVLLDLLLCEPQTDSYPLLSAQGLRVSALVSGSY